MAKKIDFVAEVADALKQMILTSCGLVLPMLIWWVTPPGYWALVFLVLTLLSFISILGIKHYLKITRPDKTQKVLSKAMFVLFLFCMVSAMILVRQFTHFCGLDLILSLILVLVLYIFIRRKNPQNPIFDNELKRWLYAIEHFGLIR